MNVYTQEMQARHQRFRLAAASRTLLLAAALAFGAIGCAQASTVNLVQNGNFDSGLAGWTKAGNWSAGGNLTVNDALWLGNSPASGLGGVLQTIDTVAGQEYTLSLDWRGTNNNYAAGQQLFQVLWDNEIVSSIATIYAASQKIVLTVLGSGSDTLVLQGFDFAGYNVVSNVSLAPLSAVPLPGTALLFGSGLIGLLCVGRKRVRA